ncbi:MAG: type II toxin-antitoxin system RelE/ParE family toxin [Patescibacteria group bacterium]|jgi:phage-related protein
MIYNNDKEFEVVFYRARSNGYCPVLEYLNGLPINQRAKIVKYIDFLKINKGYLDEPYSRHIVGKIRELRIDFDRHRHRIFYFAFVDKKLVLLHAFLKRTKKTPRKEINIAIKRYDEVLSSKKNI